MSVSESAPKPDPAARASGDAPPHTPMRIALAVATTGRRDTLRLTLPLINQQTRAPDRVILSVCDENDLDRAHLEATFADPVVIVGDKGLTKQRNRAVKAAADCDVIVFLDDDFLIAPDFLAEVEALMEGETRVTVATGTVIADGINGPGLSFEEGVRLLAGDGGADPAADPLTPTYGAYGCNMVLRLAPMRAHNITFDERLPLYGWLEDIDVSRRLAQHGDVVRSERLRGVHLGEKRGRSSGLKLGYSQVANPIYMVRKGNVRWRYGYGHLVRNVAKNTLRAFKPEPWVDRAGRLKGNLVAFWHLVTGRLKPEAMLTIDR
ncbi:MAG: glycosyltransferase [Pseudomonadota bacterium]